MLNSKPKIPKFSRKRRSSILGFIIATLLLTGLSLSFTATRIECYVPEGTCPAYIEQALSPFLGHRIMLPTNDYAKSQIMTQAKLKSLRVARRLPNTLVFRAESRTPLGNLINQESGSEVLLIDSDGIILEEKKSPTYPSLVIDGPQFSPSYITPDMINALKTLGVIQETIKKSITGRLNGVDLTFYYPDGPEIVIDLSNSQKNWLGSLQSILMRSKISSTKPKKIDLRYANPVLIYN